MGDHTRGKRMLEAIRSADPSTAVATPSSMAVTVRRARPGRSHLLPVVYLITLTILVVLVGGVAILASAHVSGAVVGASAAADRALGERLLTDLGPMALDEPRSGAELTRMSTMLDDAAEDLGLLGLALVAPDGRLVVGTGGEGATVPLHPDAIAGRPAAELIVGRDGPRLHEWFPAQLDGRTVAILRVVRDGTSTVVTAEAVRRDIALAAAGGSTVLIVVLFLVFRGAQRRLDAQTAQLLEAARRDPLTRHLTHGAALVELAAALDAGAEPVVVALVDVDNFRQLNETHGHDLGDAVLLTVASMLGTDRPPGSSIGRSGPDEFLIIGPGSAARSVSVWLEEVQRNLVSRGVDSLTGDQLPLSVSGGIAVAPLHGRSPTELLSAAAMTLGEAKSAGGGRVLISRLSYADLIESRGASFSILDGLVDAIDARDRYTRQHSEDVARYALFLGSQLGVEREFGDALREAALLHDVGKIAVPDALLRKPGQLTDAEMEVMKQHVVLGAVLVRDLSAAQLVVDGVRHHHERWDGSGYPSALEADEIPLIARIISVADAFSAMTTTRPYRRALSPIIALERLSEAAGSQLDPRLVDVFILAMESQPDPPVPSDSRAPAAWLPAETAA